MPKQPDSEGREAPSIRFNMIACGADGDLYALTDEGHILAYNGPEHGWLRLAGDEKRSYEYEPIDPDEGEEEEEEDEDSEDEE